jgi:hypothetical protein
MLEAWHDFYLLLGTAAAALTALLFVAASVGIGIVTVERAATTRAFMSPVVVHFTILLVVSLIALAPVHDRASLALLIGLAALAGFSWTMAVLPRMFHASIEWVDRLGYGLVPFLAYAALIAAAIMFWRNVAYAPEILAAAQLLLLIDNIRNAWDLTLYLVRRQGPRD